jgi:hypothetical protein
LDTFFLRVVHDGFCIRVHHRLIGLELLLIVRTVAFGADAHHELILQFDRHRICGHAQCALFHSNAAVIDDQILVFV